MGHLSAWIVPSRRFYTSSKKPFHCTFHIGFPARGSFESVKLSERGFIIRGEQILPPIACKCYGDASRCMSVVGVVQ